MNTGTGQGHQEKLILLFVGVWNCWNSWPDVTLGHVTDSTATHYDSSIPDIFSFWAAKN